MPDRRTAGLGLAAIAFSLLYFATDAIEAAQGGFSDWQLALTLVAEAAVPVIVIGLAAVQRPRLGRLGWAGAAVYAAAFAYFTYTVVYALWKDVPDFDALSDDLGAPMLAAGAAMVIGGLAFGAGTLRARVLPAWPAWCLMAGVCLVAAAQSAPEAAQLVAAGLRDAGIAGLGLALLRPRRAAAVEGSGHPGRPAPGGM